MLDVFYGAFSPACFALLGLWLVVVQIRLREWRGSAVHRRRSYGVAGGPDPLGLAAYIVAIIIYVLIGVLAFRGGLAVPRIEAILLTILVFLGFNVAWLLLFDDRSPAHGHPPATAS